MRNSLTFLFVLFAIVCNYNVYAQTQSNTPMKVTGKVVDETTGKAIEYASVVLLKQEDSSMVTGLYTTPAGTFSFDNIPEGIYVTRITFMGYDKLQKAIRVTPGKNTYVGTLRMVTAGKVLNAVEIKADKPAFSMQIDKQVFDASSIIGADGGTATDILKNVPSVDVDIDDNITLRGQSVSILVDGKPSPFGDIKTALQMIPSETIDKVEIINNPSARYDANGGGGIINIVLKKDKAIGYSVAFNGSGSTRGEQSAGINGNLRIRRYNFFAGINQRYEQLRGSGLSSRENLVSDTNNTKYFSQASNNENIDRRPGGNIGLDYFMDDKNTFTISQGWAEGNGNNDDHILLNYLNPDQVAIREGERFNSSFNHWVNYNTNLNYRHKFKKDNQELTAYASRSLGTSNNGSSYFTQNKYMNIDTVPNADDQKNTSKGRNRFWVVQSDFTSPVGKKGKIEAGAKTTFRKINSDYIATLFDYNFEDYIVNNQLSNKYDNTENIASAYFNFASAIGNLGYQVGLRAEQSHLYGYSYSRDTSVDNHYFNLFPSLFLKYNLPKNQNQSLIFNFSTRIDRPNFDQLLPYINNSDPQNIRIGNPELQPALSRKFEISYSEYFPKSRNFISFSTYYSQTNDNIDRLSTLDPKSGITTTQPMNLATNRNNGGNVYYSLNIFKWWKVNANFNLQYNRITSIVGNRENLTYGISGNTNFRLPAKFSIQVNGHWRSAGITPQGTYKAQNGIDIGARKDFNKKLVVSLNVADVLNSQQFSSHYETTTFIQDYSRKRATRFIRLSISYRIAKMDPNMFKKKKPQEEEEEKEEDKDKEKEKPKEGRL